VQITIYNVEDSVLENKIINAIDFVSNIYIEDSSNMQIEVDFRDDLPFDGHAVVDPCDEDDESPTNFEMDFNLNLLKTVELGGDQFWITLIHEMIHIKQFALNELRNYPNSVEHMGKFYKLKDGRIEMDKYMSYPWEVEAYENEKLLFEKWKLTLDIPAAT